MEIRLMQREVGRFNLLGNERTLSFSMGIYDDGKIAEIDGVKAILYYSGEPEDISQFEEVFDDLNEIFEKCYLYGSKVWSSTDYRAQCLAFSTLYNKHYLELDKKLVDKRKADIQRKIDELTKQLQYNTAIPDTLYYTNNQCLNKDILLYQKWVNESMAELDQVKEGTEKAASLADKITKYQARLDYFKSNLLTEIEYAE